MAIALQLNRMTVPDKLRALEEIWNDLLHKAETIPSPSWHADVLHAREKRVRDGSAKFSDWTDAKQRIRKHVR